MCVCAFVSGWSETWVKLGFPLFLVCCAQGNREPECFHVFHSCHVTCWGQGVSLPQLANVLKSASALGSISFPVEVNENKISTKNAFELPLIEHMDDIVDSFMGGRIMDILENVILVPIHATLTGVPLRNCNRVTIRGIYSK